MLKRKKEPKSNYYFDSFPKLAHYSVICGEMILDYLRDFKTDELEDLKTSVHLVEHEADEVKHEVTAKLLTEFMTPIDREDIFELLRLIDDVTDSIEEISLKLFIYNYTVLPPNTVPFLEITVQCMEKMEQCLLQFPHYLDRDTFDPYVKAVIQLEEQSDVLYIENMRKLESRGISFSLDDFGTGYSNMDRVSSMNFNIIKLDKSFVNVQRNIRRDIVLDNTVRMIKSLGMKIVVEGVENAEILQRFADLRCDYIQGFFFSKPLPKTEFISYVKRHNKTA